MTIHFHIPGQPVGKGRPRIGKVGAHARMFTPAKTVSYESTVALFAAQAMTGLPDLNFPAFHAEAARLRALGYEVANPAEINPEPGMAWAECMRRDIPELVRCDGVVLLEGWERSRGASLEAHIAHSLGMRLVYPGEQIGAPA